MQQSFEQKENSVPEEQLSGAIIVDVSYFNHNESNLSYANHSPLKSLNCMKNGYTNDDNSY